MKGNANEKKKWRERWLEVLQTPTVEFKVCYTTAAFILDFDESVTLLNYIPPVITVRYNLVQNKIITKNEIKIYFSDLIVTFNFKLKF